MGAWVWWVSLWVAVGARELDPEACAARFDVQRDKIIRTEESRGMGARYLSELDVGARHECLRLCCETDACDVFVFEEKSPGSCYLFNCGPPEDFRCKFTAHGNFSSGVLALSRRLAELQDQERLSHHERELASLSDHGGVSRSHPSTSTTPPPPTTTHSKETPRPTPRPLTPAPPVGRCSRYQFECRRGGECIAVYNACDGVPQCADGSDEAPELGCPAAPPPPTHAPPPPPPPDKPPPAPPLPMLPQLQMGGPESVEDSGEPWPHRLTQAQRRYNAVNGGSVGGSHIFSHKGGLMQESAFEPPSANIPWPHHAWQPPRSAPGGEGLELERGWGSYVRPDWPEEPRRAWPVPQPRQEQEIPVYMTPKEMPELPIVYSGQQQTLRDSPKKGFELTDKVQRVQPATEPPALAPPPLQSSHSDVDQLKTSPIENSTKKKALKDVVVAHKAPVESAAKPAHLAVLPVHEHFTADEHDGLSEHPPAAMLLLVLGTLMTAGLGTLIACRARAARRRRGRPRLALDSDYLVNGMYL